MTKDGDKNVETSSQLPAWVRVLLRVAAGVSLLAALAILLLSPTTENCKTEHTEKVAKGIASEQTSTTCSPDRPTLVDVLPLMALAGLFLLGELSEVSVPGIMTLKTKIETQEGRQLEVERQLSEIRFSANQQQSVIQIAGDVGYQNPQEVSASARRKAAEGTSGDQPGTTDHLGPSDGVNVQALKYRAIADYERIAYHVLIATYLDRARPVETLYRSLPLRGRNLLERLSPVRQERLLDWFNKFRPEIDLVRSVRNSVAHPPAFVTASDLQATLETLDVLYAELQRRGLIGSANDDN